MSSAACIREETEEIERTTDRIAEVSISHSVRWAVHRSGGLKSL